MEEIKVDLYHQLIHHFPFGMGLGHLKKDYIEFQRVGYL